jgi:hypothetical protein
MKPPETDVLPRLAAADPARDVPVDEVERARLWQQIAATQRESPSPRRPRAGGRQLILVIPVLLLLAAGALAAGGVIRIGAPAEPPGRENFSSLRGGGLLKGSVRLLPIATADPGGGPPWGLRVFSTKEGEGCIQVGRLVDGKLGAIGEDDAFGDDGQFHAFAESSAFAKRACTLLDGDNRLFLNATVGDMPAGAWVGYGGGCVPSTASHAERFGENGKPRALCPQADERNLYYGLLGPHAKSITYKLNGQIHTKATVGPEGAYLLVTRASPTQLFNFDAGGTQDVVPVDGPITDLAQLDRGQGRVYPVVDGPRRLGGAQGTRTHRRAGRLAGACTIGLHAQGRAEASGQHAQRVADHPLPQPEEPIRSRDRLYLSRGRHQRAQNLHNEVAYAGDAPRRLRWWAADAELAGLGPDRDHAHRSGRSRAASRPRERRGRAPAGDWTWRYRRRSRNRRSRRRSLLRADSLNAR